MKTALLLTLVLALGATVAFAQWWENGDIGIFADAAGMDCNLSDAPGLLNVYFLHVNATGAVHSQWAAPHPACLSAEHMSDVSAFPVHIGDTETGIIVGYDTCKIGTFLMTATYNVLAPASECCRWLVVPDPSVPSGKIEIGDCSFWWEYPPGGQAIINSTPDCTCSVPTEDTTWGQVKALYAE
jgi:hypothetical protein